MSLSKATQSWKRRYYLLLFVFLGGLATIGYFYGFSYWKQRMIADLDKEIGLYEEKVDQLYQNTGFKEFLAIKNLEASSDSMPRSSYVDEILSILSKLKDVEGGASNVMLSDFKVDMKELSLNGVTSNLRVLYNSTTAGKSLLDRFNELDFLKDIMIRKYERNTDSRGFSFTLSAKVSNDARTKTESRTH